MTSRLDQAKQALKTAEAGREQARHALRSRPGRLQTGSGQLQAGQDLFRIPGRHGPGPGVGGIHLPAGRSGCQTGRRGPGRRRGRHPASPGSGQREHHFHRIHPHPGPRGRGRAQTLCGARRPGPSRQTTGGPAHLGRPAAGSLCSRGIDHPRGPRGRPWTWISTPWIKRIVDGNRRRDCPLCGPQLTHLSGESGHAAVEGLYPGMFGKLRIPVGRQRIVTVPGPPFAAWGSWNWSRSKPATAGRPAM
jgi:hypothetical protein